MPLTPLLTLAAVGIAVAAVAAAHLVRRSGPIGGWNVAVAGAVVALGAVAALVGAVTLTGFIDLFVGVHVVYLVVVVTVPLVGVGLGLLAWRRGAPVAVRVLAVALLVPGVLGAYATHVEPHRLRVDHHTVAVDPARAGDDEVTVAVMADLQTTGVGDHERRAVEELLAAEPDLILLPGDLFQGDLSAGDLADVRDLLGRLEAPHGVWFVRGDTDGYDGGNADRILDGLDIGILLDEVAEVQVGDRVLRIGGTRLAFDSAEADAVRADLQATPEDGAVTILLSHRPDTALHLPPSSRVDLTVAGHTHGGQIVVPVIGPLVTLSEVPREVARGGLHEIAGNPIYVSPGVGVERGAAPQVRFGNRPAVAVLTLADAG